MFKKTSIRVLGLAAVALAGAAMVGLANKPESAKPQDVAKIGEKAPNFTLKDLDGTERTLADYTAEGNVVVLEWFNPTCPFVKKHYAGERQTMNETIKGFEGEKVVWLRVNSGGPKSRTTGVELNKKMAEEWHMTTPILLDEEGEVGHMYGAKRTPELYVIDAEGVLRYHGAMDSDNRATKIGDEIYVKTAVQQVLAGETVTTAETQPYGCAIKYAN
ncbi:MAG: redoxin domain-containing protein [Phycisphaerales bacterium]